MKTLLRSFLIVAFTIVCFTMTYAQDGNNDTYYHLLDYMKVPPGGEAEYLKLEQAWMKIHKANIDAGNYHSWHLTGVRMPTGADVEYNYVTRITCKGEQQLAKMMSNGIDMGNLEDILTKEELALFKRTYAIRTHVKGEVWYSIDYIFPEDWEEPGVIVFNFFNYPEGKTRQDHVRIERDLWMPIHKARMDADLMEAWIMVGLMSPYGSDLPYHDATVDIYKSWDQYLNTANIKDPDLETIHPGMDFNILFKKTMENADLVRQEIRYPIYRVVEEE